MRKSTITILLLFLSSFLLAQTPQKISYQAVVRDGSSLLSTSSFDVQFSILQNGNLVYQESQSVMTNEYGLFSTMIGSGTVNSGSMNSINWANGIYELEVEIDEGTGFETLGTDSLVSVPYSFYAATAGSVDNLSITDLVDVSASGANTGQVLTWDGDNWVVGDMISYQPGTGIAISGDIIENIGDTDSTNDITTSSTAGGDVSGTFGNMTVNSFSNNPLPTGTPPNAAILKWDTLNNEWIYGVDNGEVYSAGDGIDLIGGGIFNTGDTIASDDITINTSAGGDVSGLFPTLTVTRLDGNVLPSNSPSNGDVLKWSNGWIYTPDVGDFTPGTGIQISGGVISNSGDTNPNDDITSGSGASGDLGGTFPSPTVIALSGNALPSNSPSNGEILKWTNGGWVYTQDIAGPTYTQGNGIMISGNTISNTGDTNPNDDITTSTTALGDVNGTFSNLTVTGLRNNPIPTGTPGIGEILKWTGSSWVYAVDAGGTTYTGGNGISVSGSIISNTGDTDESDDITNNTNASGDVSGTFPTLTVTGLRNNSIPAGNPNAGEVLKWTGSSWSYAIDAGTTYSPGNGISFSGTTINNTGDLNASDDLLIGDAAGGDLSGTFPNPTVRRLRGMSLASSITSAQNGQILKWDATNQEWYASNDATTDADADSQNELIDSVVFNSQSQNLQITEAGISHVVSLSSLNTGSGSDLIQDADGDTRVRVEASTDEDMIRFDAGGTEMMVIQRYSTGQALFNVNPTTNSVFLGRGSGLNSDLDGFNTAVGDSALWKVGLGGSISNHGKNNTAVGAKALKTVSTGYDNVAIGSRALTLNQGGNNNTAVGAYAMQNNFNGQANVALGEAAMTSNTTGSHNVAIGMVAFTSNTTGTSNVSMGRSSMFSNTSGSNNVAIGRSAMDENTTGSANVAIGLRALHQNISNSKIVAIGDSALYFNGQSASGIDEGTRNTAIGSRAMYENNTGHRNTAVGYESLEHNISGQRNSSVGTLAMQQNETGSRNTAVGFEALKKNVGGDYNTAVGDQALLNNQGSRNSAFGRYSLQDNETGENNTGLGEASLFDNISGSGNTAVGKSSLGNNTSGANNTSVGYNAFNGNNATAYTNSTALGYDAEPTASNQVRIGNSLVSSIGGFTIWTSLSDGRFKHSVQEDVKGLDFILRLRPVSYQLNMDLLASTLGEGLDEHGKKIHDPIMEESRRQKAMVRQTGFIAQEVEQAAKELGYDFSGVDTPDNPKDHYGLRYAEFVVPLVKALQEQQAIIEAQESVNQAQDQTIQQLQARLDQLERMMQGRK